MHKDVIQRANEAVKPSGFLDYRLYLDGLYAFLKAHYESYSYQRFADDLGFGPTTVLHQIVRGRRPLTLKATEKVVKALALKGMERRFLLTLVEYDGSRSVAKREALFEKLLSLKTDLLPTEFDKDCLEYFSEWYHPVIRELVGTKSFKSDPEWIAAAIVPRLRPEQARESLELLKRLALIVFDEALATYSQTQKRVSTGHRVRGMALTRYHQRMIELGKDSLTRIEGTRRDVSAMTLSIDEAALPHLKAMLHTFQIQMMDEAEKHPGNQVYQVNIQLFPFTDREAPARKKKDDE